MSNKPTLNKAKRCYYCGEKLTPETRTLDHMTPLARGGPNRQNNRVWCCKKCNSAKMDMTVEEFFIYKQLRKLYSGKELIDKCREHGILLWTQERRERKEREKRKQEWERKNKNGD